MSPEAQLVWYGSALVMFIVAVLSALFREGSVFPWVAGGLAAYTVVPFWSAIQAV